MFTQSGRVRMLMIYYGALLLWLGTTAMHIPDGYLSPVTCIIMFLIVMPFWAIGLRRIRETLSARSVPLIALLAAFSFVVMMFNFPVPGGTTAHAIGATIAAIILGPESATIVVSIALLIQALFFGDGGITALGANSFNMAVVVPFIACAVYRAFSKNQPLTSSRRLIGAAIGGWLGLTLAAFFAGVEFGVQPLLFKAADGMPYYAPYPLPVSIPAMIIPHALVASVAEGVLSALVVAYLQRSNIAILELGEKPELLKETPMKLRWLWILMIILVIASPIGLLAPGTAWGEWSARQLTKNGLASIPNGMQQLSGIWGAPFAGYNLPALGNVNLGYAFSAVMGVAIIAVVVWLFTMLLASGTRSKKSDQ